MGLTIPANTNTDAVGELAVGTESAQQLELDAFQSTISSELTKLGIETDEQEQAAAEYSAALAVALTTGKDLTPVVGTEAQSIHGLKNVTFAQQGIVGATMVGSESFDSNDKSAVLRYTVAGAIANAKIDPASELIFPTLVIDPRLTGVVVTTEVFKIYSGYTRKNNEAADFKKTSLIKAMNTTELFNIKDNVLVPRYEAGTNDEFFETALASTTELRGQSIITAPVKVGITTDIIGISDTTFPLKQGTQNHRDAIESVQLKQLLLDAKGDGSEFIPFNLDPLQINFTSTYEGHHKSIALNLDTNVLTLNTSNTVLAGSGLPANANNAVFDGLAPNMTITFSLRLSGQGNTETGNLSVDVGMFKVLSIANAAGVIQDHTVAGPAKAIADALANMKITSFVPSVVLTNSNLRDLNAIGSVEVDSKLYDVPYRPGITIERLITQTNHIDSDTHRISSRVAISILQSRKAGYDTLMRFFDASRNILGSLGSTSNYTDLIPGTVYVNPLVLDASIDLTTALDSERSAQREEDISGALGIKIGDMVDTMLSDTNYQAAHEYLNPGEKIVINIVGGNKIIRRLHGLNLGDGIVVRTAALPMVGMEESVTITPGTINPIKKDSRGRMVADVLNFGFRAYAPTIYSDVNIGANDKYNILHNQPRYNHIIQLPIGARLTIVGLQQAINHKISSDVNQ